MARVNEFTAIADIILVMEESSNVLRGRSFSITGHLGRPRSEIVQIIEMGGGRFDKTPSWGTQFLITNQDWNEGSTVGKGTSIKLRQAQERGTRIITEAEFYKMIFPEV